MKAKSNTRPVASGSGLSYTQKISLAAGSLSALYLLPAQASIVYVSGSPVSLAISAVDGATAYWDVDSNGNSDFRLWKWGSTNTGAISFGSDNSNGRGLVGPTFYTDNVQALAKSFRVGPTLANYFVWGYGYYSGYTPRNAMATYSSTSFGIPAVGGPSFWIGYDFNFNFNVGDNYIGFRFLSGSNMLYGWADINFDTTNGIVTIKEWAYNDTADTPIHIADTGAQQVPEPSTPALTLLGLGAAGLRAWRARKKARAEEALAA